MTAPLRIASVPSDHPYVRHLSPVTGVAGCVRLPDPPVPDAPAGQWWPPQVLDPDWLRAHADDVDVVHVHFGFEHRTTTELRGVVAVLRRLGLPLVLTVHDLMNPHLADQRPHLAALDVLVPAAAAVITLTDGAAAEVRQRWARDAVVLPHPHVVPLDRLAAPRGETDGLVVGLHAKRRANNDPDAVRSELASAVAGLPGARLVPDLERRLTDDELWDHLSGLDVLVLAYRFGTHSGFVEACHDLGTTVVAPRVGHLAEQHPLLSYDLGTAGSLTAALGRAHDDKPSWRADPGERAAQRDRVADAHDLLYRAVVA
ncbi:MAG: hypothetical protein JWN08_38 [Frankiales bacterium]|nr:hypothetical protein [Frankiales bacterium]